MSAGKKKKRRGGDGSGGGKKGGLLLFGRKGRTLPWGCVREKSEKYKRKRRWGGLPIFRTGKKSAPFFRRRMEEEKEKMLCSYEWRSCGSCLYRKKGEGTCFDAQKKKERERTSLQSLKRDLIKRKKGGREAGFSE